MVTQKKEPLSSQTDTMLTQIKSGNEELRNALIQEHWKSIMGAVSEVTGRIAYDSDEFSVGLLAFNEAIDSYDATRNRSFLPFATLVIKRRVIDHIRHAQKYRHEIPETGFREGATVLEVADPSQSSQMDNVESADSIHAFMQEVYSFGITLKDLEYLSPKHQDTRILCATIAQRLASRADLSARIYMTHRLPISEIAKTYHLSKKTIDSHRKYIIILFLVTKSDMLTVKGYLSSFLKTADSGSMTH